ncbi:MAG: glycerol-3-phosphate responsive antiterminator [Lachnospiraceae bacterium]|nr:glycerol-3-phosphate responsive antiterminator [Lachnospiraceae bacterium]
MKKHFKEALEDSPIITAVKNEESLEKCLSADSKIVFILYGDVITIPNIVTKIKATGKMAFVHMDLIQGLSAKEAAVDYIAKFTEADGIISTKAPLIIRAKELNMCTIMRFFLIDSMAFANIEKQIKNVKPDVLEVLPGPMPSVIARLKKKYNAPVIASGLISEKEEVYALLNAGAQSISTTDETVWGL